MWLSPVNIKGFNISHFQELIRMIDSRIIVNKIEKGLVSSFSFNESKIN